jgi:transposase
MISSQLTFSCYYGQFIGSPNSSNDDVSKHDKFKLTQSMETPNKQYLGVDVGSKELFISQSIEQPRDKFLKLPAQKITNTVESINQWIETLSPEIHVIFESTGTYSLPLAYCLEIANVTFTIITPSQSSGYAQSKNVINRNDEIDASLLAYYGASNHPERTLLESESLHHLKQKRKHLASLMQQKQVVDNQLHALSFDSKADKGVLSSLELLQETFTIQIQQFKEESFSLSDDQYNHIYQLMTTVVGIGDASANAIIIATNGLENFSNVKQVLKFVGIIPKEKDSGTTVRKKYGIAKSGVAFVRSTLYNAAKSAKRFNWACKSIYERLRSKGKCHKVAMIEVINKLIRQVFAVVKSNTVFDNKFELTK